MERLEIARYLIEHLPAIIKKQGTQRILLAPAPSPWLIKQGALRLSLAEDVLLKLDDAATSSLLDVWTDDGKVFSACWMPDKPWLPPTIVSLKRGPWLKELGCSSE